MQIVSQTWESGKDLPLFSAEAEEATLGSILYHAEIMHEIDVRPEDFYSLRNRYVFEAILALYQRGDAIDQVTVVDELRFQGRLEAVGGVMLVLHLMDSTPTHVHALTYAAVVREYSRRRQMLEYAGQIATATAKGDLMRIESALEQATALRLERLVQTKTLLDSEQLNQIPPVEWLLGKMIPANGLTLLIAPSATYKSFFALGCAWELSQRTRTVIYVMGEGQSGYADRVAALRAYHGAEPKDLYFWPGAINLMNGVQSAEVQLLIRQAQDKLAELIVFDTLARCMAGGEENSARDVGMVIATLDAIRERTGAATMVIHHTNKARSGYRGSSALEGAADSMLELEDDGTGLILVRCRKSKDSKEFDPFYMRPVEIPMDERRTTSLVLERANQTPDHYQDSKKLTQQQRAVLAALALPIFSKSGAKIGALGEVLPTIERRTLYRILSKLIQWGYVSQDDKGEPFRATETGRSLLPAAETTSNLRLPGTI